MAASVSQFGSSTQTGTDGTKSATGLSWSSGDMIVVCAGCENQFETLNTPTNANLTFTLRASVTGGSGDDCEVYLWTAVAGSSESSQTVSVTRNNGYNWGMAAWVVTGTDGTYANAGSTSSPSASGGVPTDPAFTASAGSVVIYHHGDWNASSGLTQYAASGTATERLDGDDTSNWGWYYADWAGVDAGSDGWGPTSYSGVDADVVWIEVLAAAVAATSFPPTNQSAKIGHLLRR